MAADEWTVRDEPPDLELQVKMEEHVGLLAARRQFGNKALLHEDRRAMQTLPVIDMVRRRKADHCVAVKLRRLAFCKPVVHPGWQH